MRQSAIPVLMIAFLLLVVMVPHNTVSAADDVFIRLDGPVALATGDSGDYTLTISGGPGEDGGNFSYTISLDGLNVTDASASPMTGSSTTGTFSINITAPSIPQTLKVIVNATSANAAKSVTVEKTFSIQILRPIVITEVLKNNGDMDARDVLVKFYVDEKFIGSKVVDVPAHSNTTVSFRWIAIDEEPGVHTIKVEADPNNELVEFAEGNNVVYKTIYIEGTNILNTALWGIIGGLLVLLFFLYTMKGKRKKYARKYR